RRDRRDVLGRVLEGKEVATPERHDGGGSGERGQSRPGKLAEPRGGGEGVQAPLRCVFVDQAAIRPTRVLLLCPPSGWAVSFDHRRTAAPVRLPFVRWHNRRVSRTLVRYRSPLPPGPGASSRSSRRC